MSAFRYRAFDLQGTPSTGVIEADSGRAARSALRERGLHPVEVIDLGQQARAAAEQGEWGVVERLLAEARQRFADQP
jgi:general secretion pathway protein F